MTLTYGDVVYNPTAAYAATFSTTPSYGTPVQIDYLGDFDFDYDADTDELMSGGRIVETLAITKKATGTIKNGALSLASMAVLLGWTEGDYTTYEVMDAPVGGSGLPYFGLIVAFAATNGANVLVGFPKAKLQKPPGWTIAQNKFRIGEAKFDAVPAGTTDPVRAVRVKKNQTAASIPTDASSFLAFFTTPPPSLFA